MEVTSNDPGSASGRAALLHQTPSILEDWMQTQAPHSSGPVEEQQSRQKMLNSDGTEPWARFDNQEGSAAMDATGLGLPNDLEMRDSSGGDKEGGEDGSLMALLGWLGGSNHSSESGAGDGRAGEVAADLQPGGLLGKGSGVGGAKAAQDDLPETPPPSLLAELRAQRGASRSPATTAPQPAATPSPLPSRDSLSRDAQSSARDAASRSKTSAPSKACSTSAAKAVASTGDSAPAKPQLLSAGESRALDTILEQLLREDGSKVTPGQEAALLAGCSDPSLNPTPRDRLQEESMLAGLGVISPDEIGGSQTLEKKVGGGLLAELRMHGAQGLLARPERVASVNTDTPRFPASLSETLSSGEESRRGSKPFMAASHSTTKEGTLLQQLRPQVAREAGMAHLGGRRPQAEARPTSASAGLANSLLGHVMAPGFGSGALTAQLAGARSPQRLQTGPNSPRAITFVSRASSPPLSTFGSGTIASDLARGGNTLCSLRSSPIPQRHDLGGGALPTGLGLGPEEEEELLLGVPGGATGLYAERARLALLPEEELGGWGPGLGRQGLASALRTSRSPSPKPASPDVRLAQGSGGPQAGDGWGERPNLSKRHASPEQGVDHERANPPRKRVLPTIPASIFARDDAPGWRPPPSPPHNGTSPPRAISPGQDDSGSRFWTVHSLNSWAHGDRNMLQSRRSSLHSKSSIQSQPSFHSWAGPRPGLDSPAGVKLAPRFSGGLEFVRNSSPEALRLARAQALRTTQSTQELFHNRLRET